MRPMRRDMCERVSVLCICVGVGVWGGVCGCGCQPIFCIELDEFPPIPSHSGCEIERCNHIINRYVAVNAFLGSPLSVCTSFRKRPIMSYSAVALQVQTGCPSYRCRSQAPFSSGVDGMRRLRRRPHATWSMCTTARQRFSLSVRGAPLC